MKQHSNPGNEEVCMTRGNKDTFLRIHELVETGQLKEGGVITFFPNSHVPSGSGIATIFDFVIEGWHTTIGANLQPCHPGVLSFSPRDSHQCTVSLPLSDDPLPRSVLCHAKIIEEICGYCTISGSATLAKYLRDLPGCQHCYEEPIAKLCQLNKSNDVNLFVPMYPESISLY